MPPLNLGVLNTSQKYGFSIAPWLQALKYPYTNVGNSTHFNQETLDILSHMDQENASNSKRSSNEDTKPIRP